MRFTGHERDQHGPQGEHLDYMHSRFCSPHFGRFLTVDPIVRRSPTGHLQAWNRYVYGDNSPLKYVDPDGRDVIFANDEDRQFYENAAARESRVRAVLDYFGPDTGRNLIIGRGDPGKNEKTGRQRKGVAVTSIGESTGEEIMAAYNKAGGGEAGNAAADAINSLPRHVVGAEITLGPGADEKTKLHELGHVEQAILMPEEYEAQAKEASSFRSASKYDRSESEKYANRFYEDTKEKKRDRKKKN